MPESPSPEQDVEAARAALAAGDLAHASRHLAGALAVAPDRLELMALVEELIARGPENAAQLAPKNPSGPTFIGVVVLRAHLLARTGSPTEALDLLLSAAAAEPSLPYLARLPDWLDRPGFIEALDPSGVASATVRVLQQLPVEDAGAQVLPLLGALARIRAAHPAHAQLMLVHSRLSRRLGQPEEGLRIALEFHARHPQYLSAVVVGASYRELRRYGEALESYREASRLAPDDLPVRMDTADLLMQLDRGAEALELYEGALRQEPEHAWALPSAYFLRYALGQGTAWREKLEALAKATPPNGRAVDLVRALAEVTLRPGGTAYVDFLPEPSDAIVRLVGQLLATAKEKPPVETPLEVTVSSLEAPSAVASARAQLAALGWPRLTLRVERMAEPDPREPVSREALLLWRYEGTEAVPALPPPAPEVVMRVTRLAEQPFQGAAWRALAQEMAAGLTMNQVDELPRAMLYPAPAPPGEPAWRWWLRVQVASAFLLAACPERRGGLTRLFRKREAGVVTLLRLVDGPSDWCGVAAAIALAERVHDDEVLRRPVLLRLMERLRGRPKEGYWCLEHPLVSCALRLCKDPEVRGFLEDYRRRLEG